MQQLNRYYRRSKISEHKFRQILRHFALDLTASDVAHLTGLSRRSVTTSALFPRERGESARVFSVLHHRLPRRYRLPRSPARAVVILLVG